MCSLGLARTSLAEGNLFYDFMIAVIKDDSPLDVICLQYYLPNSDAFEL